jgi:hypothetical protein
MRRPESDLAKQLTEGHVPINELVAMAERELTAFAGAVNELFGPEQALLSADEWIEELLALDFPVGSRIPDWRHITIIASSRLAKRSISTTSRPRGPFRILGLSFRVKPVPICVGKKSPCCYPDTDD